ncbi:ImmA/IrrE family metallo-endopeptidase [Corynebacterium pacaense]
MYSARRRTPEGTRFDLAHELGHLVMHSSASSSSTMSVVKLHHEY